VNENNPLGIRPDSWLEFSDKNLKLRAANWLGMFPVNWLPYMFKFVRLRMPPSSVGIVPVSWLVYAMLCSHALHVGKVSPNHIKRKHKYHAG